MEARLNPPQGIFCWEGCFVLSGHAPTTSQSPTGDFLLGSLYIPILGLFSLSQSPTGDFLLGRVNYTKYNIVAICLNPPQGIFCWEVGNHKGEDNEVERLNPPQGIFCWEGW